MFLSHVSVIKRKSKLCWDIKTLTSSILGARDMTFVSRILGANSFSICQLLFWDKPRLELFVVIRIQFPIFDRWSSRGVLVERVEETITGIGKWFTWIWLFRLGTPIWFLTGISLPRWGITVFISTSDPLLFDWHMLDISSNPNFGFDFWVAVVGDDWWGDFENGNGNFAYGIG